MPYKLISLVFISFFLIINSGYSENEFLLPAKKPPIFKKIESKVSENINSNLPVKKPRIKTSESNRYPYSC